MMNLHEISSHDTTADPPVYPHTALCAAVESVEQGSDFGRDADKFQYFPEGCVVDCVEALRSMNVM